MPISMTTKQLNDLLSNDKVTVTEGKESLKRFYSNYNKYGNKKIKRDGMTFDSLGECDRYYDLLLQQKAKMISDLEFHKKKNNIILIDDPLVVYEPDYRYIENGKIIIEDFKGTQTKEFILKKKIIINMLKKNKLSAVLRIVKKEASKFIIVEEYSNDNGIFSQQINITKKTRKRKG